ncbi:MAG: hypothetical protein R3B96_22630 [Pirellulaceae bacterium]
MKMHSSCKPSRACDERDSLFLMRYQASLNASGINQRYRATFEAIGRSGDLTMAELALPLASTFGDESNDDSRRVLEHSLTYALIELAMIPSVGAKRSNGWPSRVDGLEAEARLVAIALDQLGAEDRIVEAVLGWLGSKDVRQRETAEWLVANHGEWAERIEPRLLELLDEVEDGEPLPAWVRAGVVRPELGEPLRDWLHRKLSAEKDLDALARRIRRLPVEAVTAWQDDWLQLLDSVSGDERVELSRWVAAADRDWLEVQPNARATTNLDRSKRPHDGRATRLPCSMSIGVGFDSDLCAGGPGAIRW